jgi:hypothetical protein
VGCAVSNSTFEYTNESGATEGYVLMSVDEINNVVREAGSVAAAARGRAGLGAGCGEPAERVAAE